MWVVYSRTYQPSSHGIKVCYYLAELLQQSGREARVFVCDRETEDVEKLVPARYRPFIWEGSVEADDIVVYPETVAGNPFEAQRVVRYLLNRPYYYAGQKIDYGLTDYIVAHTKRVDATTPNLVLLYDESKVLRPCYDKESLACVYYGKTNTLDLPPRVAEFLQQFDSVVTITRQWPASRNELFDLLRRAAVVVSLDPLSHLAFEATLLGTPCWIVHDMYNTRNVPGEVPPHGFFYFATGFEGAKARVKGAYPAYLKTLAGQPALVARFADDVERHFRVLSELQRRADGTDQLAVVRQILRQRNLARAELEWLRFQSCGGKSLQSIAVEDLLVINSYRWLRKKAVDLLGALGVKQKAKRLLRGTIFRLTRPQDL